MVESSEPSNKLSTPESEKPRVQLELSSKTQNSGSPSISNGKKRKQNGNSGQGGLSHQHQSNDEHLDLIKRTVAHLKSHEDESAMGEPSAEAIQAAGSEAEGKSFLSGFETAQQEILSSVAELQKGTGQAAEMSFEQRADALNDLFMEKVLPLLRRITEASTETSIEEQLLYWQTLDFQNRQQKAEVIRQKYEQITREYQGQNVQYQERHNQISCEEKDKREKYKKNFDDHLSTIKEQMAADIKQSKEEHEALAKETEYLKEKYEELQKECAEKTEQMEKQLSEQGSKQGSIETTLNEQIDGQAEQLTKQVTAYKEQTKVKLEEEKQLLNVLKEYKAKFNEFKVHTKSSQQSRKKFQKEVQKLTQRRKELNDQYRRLAQQLDIDCPPEEANEHIQKYVASIEQREAEWEAEKIELTNKVNEIKDECKNLQQAVAEQKQAQAQGS